MMQIFVVLTSALAGFAAGGVLAGAFLVAPGAGLAGAAEVVLYSAASSLASILLAGLAVRRAGPKTLMAVSLALVAFLAVLFVIVLMREDGPNEASPPSAAEPRATTAREAEQVR